MISLISWIIAGLVIGLIARAIVPGRQPMGFLMTVILGVVGACVGGLISSAIWPTWANEPDVSRMWPGWLMSILGGVIVLWGYLALSGDNRIRTRI